LQRLKLEVDLFAGEVRECLRFNKWGLDVERHYIKLPASIDNVYRIALDPTHVLHRVQMRRQILTRRSELY
jgi:hypothetical protein